MHPITFTVFLLFSASLMTLNLTLLKTVFGKFKSEDFQLVIIVVLNIALSTPMVYLFGEEYMSNGAMILVGIVLGVVITAVTFGLKDKI